MIVAKKRSDWQKSCISTFVDCRVFLDLYFSNCVCIICNDNAYSERL